MRAGTASVSGEPLCADFALHPPISHAQAEPECGLLSQSNSTCSPSDPGGAFNLQSHLPLLGAVCQDCEKADGLSGLQSVQGCKEEMKTSSELLEGTR